MTTRSQGAAKADDKPDEKSSEDTVQVESAELERLRAESAELAALRAQGPDQPIVSAPASPAYKDAASATYAVLWLNGISLPATDGDDQPQFRLPDGLEPKDGFVTVPRGGLVAAHNPAGATYLETLSTLGAVRFAAA